MKFKIDGQVVQVVPADLDGDGVVGSGHVEQLTSGAYSGVTRIQEPSELKDMLRELNDDTIDPATNMSSIDMKSRLHFAEIPSILAVDALVSYNFLTTDALAITRIKKRLSVSINGEGRREAVDAINRKNEVEAKKGGFMNGFKGFFGMGGSE